MFLSFYTITCNRAKEKCCNAGKSYCNMQSAPAETTTFAFACDALTGV